MVVVGVQSIISKEVSITLDKPLLLVMGMILWLRGPQVVVLLLLLYNVCG